MDRSASPGRGDCRRVLSENEVVAGGTDRPTYAAKAPMPVQAPSFGQFSDVFPASGAR